MAKVHPPLPITADPYLGTDGRQALFQAWLCVYVATVSCQQQVLATSALTVEIATVPGPIPALAAATGLPSIVQDILQAGQVQDLIRDTRHRVLGVDHLYGSGSSAKRERNSLRVVIADYTNGRTVYASLDDAFGPLSDVYTETSNIQPVPNDEEAREAAEIAGFGPNATFFLQMPPMVNKIHPNGSSSRVINMIAHGDGDEQFTSVHVDMNLHTATTVQQATKVQTTAVPSCTGVTEVMCPLSGKGKTGIVSVKIKQGTTLLWELEVVRPSASSGNQGSGIELLNVQYRGKLLLKRAHVPILNVNYLEQKPNCGPYYRDWQYDETYFDCPGDDESGIPDFRRCKSPSKTLVDQPVDGGNFTGVAFDITDTEVVIRSQLTAGWYRYTSEWHLRADGTILPRWGFAGVRRDPANCVCVQHHHHVYWRLDFDIETATSNVLRECDGSNCTIVLMEKSLEKKTNRHWEVANTLSNRFFRIDAGAKDGAAADTNVAYGVGDLWVVKYQQSKYEDGFDGENGAVTDDSTAANFKNIMNSASLSGQDIVVWYSAHFIHDQMHSHDGDSHVVGPQLSPGTWT